MMNPMIKTLTFFIAFAFLFAGGCAPQPVSPAAQMQQTIDELRQVQQQQAQQLEQLVQQLVALQPPGNQNPPGAIQTPKTVVSVPETLVPMAENAAQNSALAVQSSAEIAALTESSALYLQAFGALATGRVSTAEQSFRAFIEKYPQHEFSGNARYWLAEALIAQQNPAQAEAVLLEIIDSSQEQQRAAAAMARLIDIYQQRGAIEQARATLQQLSRRYPASPELQRFAKDPTLF
ncbi:MAG: tetratricopeptide repeat protein [Deltaproteobacteria bacterium]|nr:tetratricopeptide repeat protein [Deltaproteobacteria bacterium]